MCFILFCTCVSENASSYDHLSECLSKILDERPNNSVGELLVNNYSDIKPIFVTVCVDIFENISQTVKKERYQPEPDTLQVSGWKSRDRGRDR